MHQASEDGGGLEIQADQELASDFDAREFIEHRNETSDELDKMVRAVGEELSPDFTIDDLVDRFLSLPEEDRAYLWEFSDDREVAAAAVLGMLAVKGQERKSGRSYGSHSKQVALTTLELATDVPKDVRKRSAIIAEGHDIIEEDTVKAYKGKKEQSLGLADLSQAQTEEAAISQARAKLNEMIPGHDMGDAVVTIMEPLVPDESMRSYQAEGASKYLVEYAFFAQLLKEANDPAVINAEISDRIDDILDIDYITKSSKLDDDAKKAKLIDKFGKCVFTIGYITQNNEGFVPDVSERLTKAFNVLVEAVVEEQSNVTMNEVNRRADDFREFVERHESAINSDLNLYLEKTGSKLGID